jgi:DNA polymerase-3 subunit epsilon
MFGKNKHTAHPAFWTQYLTAFKEETKKNGMFGNTLKDKNLKTTRFVAFDTETTGLNTKEDRMLSIGAIGIQEQTIMVEDSLELFVNQEHYKPESALIHGILKEGHFNKISEIEAIERFLSFIGTDILIGHHIGFDIGILNSALKRHGLGKLKNKSLDTGQLYKRLLHPIHHGLQNKQYTLDALSEALKIPLYDRHTSAGDAMITAMAFLKIATKFNDRSKHALQYLFKS